MSRIYASVNDLDAAAGRVKEAALNVSEAGAGLRGTRLPHMPADVRARVALELSEALDDLRVVTADSATLAMMLARTAMKFRKTDGDSDSQVALGAALNALDAKGQLVAYIAGDQLLPGEAPDGPFTDWENFLKDLALGAGSAAWLVEPAHWEVVKVKKGITNRGKVVMVRKTGRSTRYLYYARYARNQLLTKVLNREVPKSKLNYKLIKTVPAAKIPHGVGIGKALGGAGIVAGAVMDYANAAQRHGYNLTLDDGGVRERAGLESGIKTGASAAAGAGAGTACGLLAAPTFVGAVPAAVACGAAGSWLGGTIAGGVIGLFK